MQIETWDPIMKNIMKEIEEELKRKKEAEERKKEAEEKRKQEEEERKKRAEKNKDTLLKKAELSKKRPQGSGESGTLMLDILGNARRCFCSVVLTLLCF